MSGTGNLRPSMTSPSFKSTTVRKSPSVPLSGQGKPIRIRHLSKSNSTDGDHLTPISKPNSLPTNISCFKEVSSRLPTYTANGAPPSYHSPNHHHPKTSPSAVHIHPVIDHRNIHRVPYTIELKTSVTNKTTNDSFSFRNNKSSPASIRTTPHQSEPNTPSGSRRISDPGTHHRAPAKSHEDKYMPLYQVQKGLKKGEVIEVIILIYYRKYLINCELN